MAYTFPATVVGRQMIARRRQRRAGAPEVARRIVDLDCRAIGLPIVAADRVQLAFVHGNRQRAASGRHGRALAPRIGGRIIGVYSCDGLPDAESRLPVAANDVQVARRPHRCPHDADRPAWKFWWSIGLWPDRILRPME